MAAPPVASSSAVPFIVSHDTPPDVRREDTAMPAAAVDGWGEQSTDFAWGARLSRPSGVTLPTPSQQAAEALTPRPSYYDLSNVQGLVQSWCREHLQLTPGMALCIAKQIVQCDRRFADNASAALRELWRLPDDAACQQAVENLPASAYQEAVSTLTDDLVSLAYRPANTILLGPENAPFACLQTPGHISEGRRLNGDAVFRFEPGCTLSSNAANKRDRYSHRPELRAYGANCGSVCSPEGLVAWRSARPDTVKKLEECLLGSLTTSLQAAMDAPATRDGTERIVRARGLHGGDTLQFRVAVITALDTAWFKSIGSTLVQGINEGRQFELLEHASDSLFDGLKHEGDMRPYWVDVRGRDFKVQVRKPVIIRTVLSGQSGNPGEIERARQDNRAAAITLALDLAEAWSQKDDQASQIIACLLNDCFDVVRAKAVFRSMPMQAAYNDLGLRQRLALDWLALMLVNHDVSYRSWKDATAPGRELILLKHLLDEVNTAAAVSCKSGVDRTGTAVALLTATEAFARIYGTPFDPDCEPADRHEMRRLFTRVANAFVAPVMQWVRGTKGHIKWDGNAVAHAWYRSDDESNDALGPMRWSADSTQLAGLESVTDTTHWNGVATVQQRPASFPVPRTQRIGSRRAIDRVDFRDSYWKQRRYEGLLRSLAECVDAWSRQLHGLMNQALPAGLDQNVQQALRALVAHVTLAPHQRGDAAEPAPRQRYHDFVLAFRQLDRQLANTWLTPYTEQVQRFAGALAQQWFGSHSTHTFCRQLLASLRARPGTIPPVVRAADSRDLIAHLQYSQRVVELQHNTLENNRWLRRVCNVAQEAAGYVPDAVLKGRTMHRMFEVGVNGLDGFRRMVHCLGSANPIQYEYGNPIGVTAEFRQYVLALPAHSGGHLIFNRLPRDSQHVSQTRVLDSLGERLRGRVVTVSLPSRGAFVEQTGPFAADVSFATLATCLLNAVMSQTQGFVIPLALRTRAAAKLPIIVAEAATATRKRLGLSQVQPLSVAARRAAVADFLDAALPLALLALTGVTSYNDVTVDDCKEGAVTTAYMYIVSQFHRVRGHPTLFADFMENLDALVFAPAVIAEKQAPNHEVLHRLTDMITAIQNFGGEE